MRGMFAAVFPLFIHPIYRAMGIGWATSVFGFCAVPMIPIPFLSFAYVPKIRAKGKYSTNIN